MLILKLLSFLKEQKATNLDAPETTLQHREIILRKPFLKKIYLTWYSTFLKALPELPEGKIVEITHEEVQHVAAQSEKKMTLLMKELIGIL